MWTAFSQDMVSFAIGMATKPAQTLLPCLCIIFCASVGTSVMAVFVVEYNGPSKRKK